MAQKYSSLITLRNVEKTYIMGQNAQTVLHDVCLEIREGEMTAIMGPSGSGKSTMMNIIGLLDRPSKGHFYISGRETSTLKDDELAKLRNEKIGFIFQQFFLLPRLTAAQNVALPLTYRGERAKTIKPKVDLMLEKVGMTDRSHHKPNELSGGQQQRVAIARALVGNPDILLADEPTGALDSKTGEEVMSIFRQLHDEEGKTVIIITHDPKVSEQCKRVIRLSDGYVQS